MQSPKAKSIEEEIKGLTVEEAQVVLEGKGMVVRVRKKDGQGMIGTCDYRTDRVNVSTKDGKIVGVSGIG